MANLHTRSGNLDLYLVKIKDIPLLTTERERELLQGIDCYTRPLRAFEDILKMKRPSFKPEDRKFVIQKMPMRDLDEYLKNRYPKIKFTEEQKSILSKSLLAMKQNYQRALPMMKLLEESNLRLVISLVKKHLQKYPFGDVEEFVSAGNQGLWRAIERFDCKHQTRFGTYAGISIKTEIRKYIANHSRTVRVASWVYSARGEALKQRTYSLSRNGTISPKLEAKLFYIDKSVDQKDESEFLYSLIKKFLDPVKRQIIEMRFGLNGYKEMTQEEIADVLHLTKQRISQLQQRALETLFINKSIREIYDSHIK